MANRVKGERSLKALDQEWTLHFSTNALCELEDALEMSALVLAQKWGSLQQALAPAGGGEINMEALPGFKEIRTFFRCGLSDHHPDVDDKTAGEIMDAVGLGESFVMILECLAASFPDVGEADGGNPPKGGSRGTGKTSSKQP